MSDTRTPVHLSVLLDRSGSMAQIADDVVGGFNTFLGEQREEAGEARVTLIQFDGQDSASVEDLDPRRYQPRADTPLLDAIGALIARIDGEIVSRADMGLPIEDQVVVIITDGLENASREFSGQMISDLVTTRKERAWTFVFLGADEESIRESVAIGMAARSTSRWSPTKDGTDAMFKKMSKETSAYRSMDRHERRSKSERFFEDDDESSEE